MKKLVLILLVCWVSCAQAAEGITIQPYSGGFAYQFQADEQFVNMRFETDAESAQCVVFSETGNYSGQVELLNTFAKSKLEVSVETLEGKTLHAQTSETIPVETMQPGRELAPMKQSRKLKDVTFTPLVAAMQYHFCAPGHTALLLKYRSSTEKGAIMIHAGEDYDFNGILPLPFTYNNSNVVLTVANQMDNDDLYETMLRTDYPVPRAPQLKTGRLEGITVCIDPGHQEIARVITEQRGPGLRGTKETGVGMARGTITRRLESIVVLEIGLMLRDALTAEGATVIMTRETQHIYLSNRNRAEIAAQGNADFLLRLHCNNRDEAYIQGIAVYCPYSSSYAKTIADQATWLAMGDILLSAMQQATGQPKGGVATTNQYIGNNWATMPSFLIEMGYMSNPTEDLLLSAKPYQQKLVEGMVEGIYELAVYCNLLTI